MPPAATASLAGFVASAATAAAGTVTGLVSGPAPASVEGLLSRQAVESLTGPSIAYAFFVKLAGDWIPAAELAGPFEIDESIDTVAVLFSFALAGRRWSIQATERTWTLTPVEVWVTAGPFGATRTWRRAFGVVITCEQTEGLEPSVRVRCGDPSRLLDRLELCYEFAADEGLTRGAICAEILGDAGFISDVPAGALYTKPVITDSQRLWPFLAAFAEAEGWSWRFRDQTTVEAYDAVLREPPEPADDVWTLRDIVSISSAPAADVPSRWVLRSTRRSETAAGVSVTKTREEVYDFHARKRAISMQQGDGSLVPVAGVSAEVFEIVSASETETHEQAGLTIASIDRTWAWYNPRAARYRSAGAAPPGPVEDGYSFAQAFIDEEGAFRAWRQEAFVQTAERRELPAYDAEGTEISRRIETFQWYRRRMGTRTIGSASPNAVNAGVGDDGVSWFAFEVALSSLLRIEEYGLAQVDTVVATHGPTGAVASEIQSTWAWYSPRTAVSGVPWFLNYDGTGQKDLVAPFQQVSERTTRNRLSEDGLLEGKVETSVGWVAPRRVGGAYDWGDFESNLQAEYWGASGLVTTSYRVLDENSYEEVVDDGTGAKTRLVMGRVPRPRYRSSSWTRWVQTSGEVVLEDSTAGAWFGQAPEVLTLDYVQSPEEAVAVARRRRARKLAHVHTVVRPICAVRPGDTVLLVDPRSGIHHRCLVIRRSERWSFDPRPQILATYTLEQPLA